MSALTSIWRSLQRGTTWEFGSNVVVDGCIRACKRVRNRKGWRSLHGLLSKKAKGAAKPTKTLEGRKMALVLCSNPLALNAVSSRPSNVTAATHRMLMNPMIEPHPKCCSGVRLHMPMVARKSVVKASSDPTEAPSDIKEEAVPVDKLPLESKLQERLEQKTRMKLAKKIRLRRKRLVRKRKLRKKGRWPPSKMNKLKNV